MINLTRKEREILEMIACGKTDLSVAWSLGIGVQTVKNHLREVRIKLGAPNTLAAVLIAYYLGLIILPSIDEIERIDYEL